MWQSLFSWNHMHPALVHFTIALLPASLVTDLIGRFADRHSVTDAAWWPLVFGAVAAPLTAIAGWLWASELGTAATGSLLNTHRLIGTALGISLPLLAAWRGSTFSRSQKPGFGYIAFAAVLCVVLAYQGFTGGEMTIG